MNKINKILAILALIVIIVIFISIAIIGLFFKNYTNIMLGLIIGLTIFCSLIYFLLMFIKLRKNEDED